VHIRAVGLKLLVVSGIAATVASCSSAPVGVKPAVSTARSGSGGAVSGSPTASPVAPSSAAAVPAGYTRVGGVAQGISVAAPASWVAINLAKETIQSAAKKIGLSGITASNLVKDMETLQKVHAVMVFDVKSAVDSPKHFAPNLSAVCVASGVTDVGAAAVPLIRTGAAAEVEKEGATHLSQKDLEIGGVPGVETSYQLNSSSEGTIYGSQLEVLPKPDKACFVTVTAGARQSEGNVLSVAARTAQFP
jgi:hypothetical protein